MSVPLTQALGAKAEIAMGNSVTSCFLFMAGMIAAPSCHAAHSACDKEAFADPSDLLVAERASISFSTLHHGTGCYSDNPDSAESCDWETSMKSDQMLGPDRRMIIAASNHNTGSGAWGYVLVFDCARNGTKLVFQERFLYGVKVELATTSKLVLTGGWWAKGDPVGGPSPRVRNTFFWSDSRERYTLGPTKIVERGRE